METQAAFELVRLPNGVTAIRDNAVGEVCHPTIGPAAEAQALYVDQLRLKNRVAEADGVFVIWDVGLGGAANALTVLEETRESDTAIRLLSFDRSLGALRFAAKHAEELGYFNSYSPAVHALEERREILFEDSSRQVHWTLHEGDFPAMLRSGQLTELPTPHAILFDAYSPKRNPGMWTMEVFSNLYAHLDPNRRCQLATYSRSTALRVTLLLAGFFVGRGRACGQKEETTVATNILDLLEEPLDRRWLDRAKLSSSAEPLVSPHYCQHPLRQSSHERLRRHPQFG